MMPEMLEAAGKISRSEPTTITGHLAGEMIIELLQIAIESDDKSVTSDAESILTLYENN
jgi:hypothetical protein